MKQRLIAATFSAALGLASAGAIAQFDAIGGVGQGNAGPPVALPFRQIDAVADDGKKALYFFSFACPYCREHDEAIRAWGAGLPAPVAFDAYPIITDLNDAVLARAYFAAELIDPPLAAVAARLLYDLAAFGAAFNAEDAFTQVWPVMQHLGVSRDAFGAAWRDTRVRERMQQAVEKTAAYRLRVTPSIGVAGAFVVSSAATNGDYDVMFAVANGLVSLLLQQRNPV